MLSGEATNTNFIIVFGLESAEGAPRRQVGKIEVKFTPRVFPTAARESQNPLEEEVSSIIAQA
jgi:hypothetical protein